MKALQEIAKGECIPVVGLCKVVEDIYPWQFELFEHACKLWTGRSGYYIYPVPHQTVHPQIAFHTSESLGTLYEGEYGESRKALAQFAYDYIEEYWK